MKRYADAVDCPVVGIANLDWKIGAGVLLRVFVKGDTCHEERCGIDFKVHVSQTLYHSQSKGRPFFGRTLYTQLVQNGSITVCDIRKRKTELRCLRLQSKYGKNP